MTTAIILTIGAVLVASLAADTKHGAIWCLALLLLAAAALSAWYGAAPIWGLVTGAGMIILWLWFLASLKPNSGD